MSWLAALVPVQDFNREQLNIELLRSRECREYRHTSESVSKTGKLALRQALNRRQGGALLLYVQCN